MPLERFSEYCSPVAPKAAGLPLRAGKCEVVDRDRPQSEKIGFWGDAFLFCKY
ncbi:hypothetical protein QUB05_01350 [Microcoleus sp. F10-C6]|uniref:hypothetical protein n=1 Tax=unclassified Microcoleus TaxID=2642155 RepID=UPI002FD704D6